MSFISLILASLCITEQIFQSQMQFPNPALTFAQVVFIRWSRKLAICPSINSFARQSFMHYYNLEVS